MIYKWLCLLFLLIIIYLLRCYWLPIIQNITPKELVDKSSSEQLYYPDINEKLKWQSSDEIMPFIGSLDYEMSRKFYAEIGFLVEAGEKHCRVKVNERVSFWLQNYSNKEWLNNSMLFLAVENLDKLKLNLKDLDIETKYQNVKISESQMYEWGDEFFMHDPSGVLWHFCEYNTKESTNSSPNQ